MIDHSKVSADAKVGDERAAALQRRVARAWEQVAQQTHAWGIAWMRRSLASDAGLRLACELISELIRSNNELQAELEQLRASFDEAAARAGVPMVDPGVAFELPTRREESSR